MNGILVFVVPKNMESPAEYFQNILSYRLETMTTIRIKP